MKETQSWVVCDGCGERLSFAGGPSFGLPSLPPGWLNISLDWSDDKKINHHLGGEVCSRACAIIFFNNKVIKG